MIARIENGGSAGGASGKGQPSVTGYSYAASFAVLLSARPIVRVGRIWADGELIRGAAGDWKVPTGFRLHAGGEEQAADPLIQSAEGGLAPAHRGCAYVVFEQLQLATFGNRIPSLSFEVVADEAAVPVGAMARELAGVTGAAGMALDGFAASGSAREVLELLGEVSGAWWAPVGAGLSLRDTPGPVTVVADQRGTDAGRRIAAADAAPGEVSIRHYDPARDWQAGLQRARGAGRGGTLSLDVPAALSAAAAKGVAAAVLARREAARVRRTVTARLDALALGPGDTMEIAGEAGLWRVEQVTLATDGVTLELSPQVGGTVRLMATGVGDPDPVVIEVPVTGASVRPPAPVNLRVEPAADGGAVVRWTRRRRIGWRWLDGADAPLGEERESYRVTIAGNGVREVEVFAPAIALSAAERAGCTVLVRQRGTFGESDMAMMEVK